MTALTVLVENESFLLALFGCFVLCYYKTLKSVLMSNCEKVNCFCLKFERPAMTDATLLEMNQTSDENRRGVP